MEAKKPVEVYARSVDKALGPEMERYRRHRLHDHFDDGAIYHGVISWALPEVWPGAVYSLEVGAVGTEGVLTIDDTHRDIVLAVNQRRAKAMRRDKSRRVDFLTAIRSATLRWANCAGRCARKPIRG